MLIFARPSSSKFSRAFNFYHSVLNLQALSELCSYNVGQSKPKVLRLVFEEMVFFLNIFALSLLSQLVTGPNGESKLIV